MSSKTTELAAKWFEIAQEDFEMAQLSYDKDKMVYSAFHLQQSMEKTLKGLFVFFEKAQPPCVHDLTRLADELQNELMVDLIYRSFFAELNPFYIKARYTG